MSKECGACEMRHGDNEDCVTIATLKELAERAVLKGESLLAERDTLQSENERLTKDLAERTQRSDVWMKSDAQAREYANTLEKERDALKEENETAFRERNDAMSAAMHWEMDANKYKFELSSSNARAERLSSENERLQRFIYALDKSRVKYRDALLGFSKHCIKPTCKCWSCEALSSPSVGDMHCPHCLQSTSPCVWDQCPIRKAST